MRKKTKGESHNGKNVQEAVGSGSRSDVDRNGGGMTVAVDGTVWDRSIIQGLVIIGFGFSSDSRWRIQKNSRVQENSRCSAW